MTSVKKEMRKLNTFAVFIIFVLFSIPIIIQDIKHQKIPDKYTIIGIAVLLIGCIFDIFLPFKQTLIGMLFGFSLFVLVRMATKGKLGLGDAKYAAFLGGILGLRLWLASVLIASLCGLAVCLILIIMKRMKRRSEERRVGKECRSRWSPSH